MKINNDQDERLAQFEGRDLHLGFGLLVSLMTLEFINAETENKKQKVYRNYWREQQELSNETEIFEEPRLVIQAAVAADERYNHLEPQERLSQYLDYVKLFVLPAVE